MASFKIGISMAGAISAGAYTAGVLDFLTEALDEWQKARARGELVPPHEVSIEVISGASAGGICAAISTVMLQDEFEHIHDTSKTGTTNRLYESWVNQIDIRKLLGTDDLKSAPPILSLLDSTIIDSIANDLLRDRIPLPAPRPYVSPNLTLFLSLTNLRGTPYSLNGAAPGSPEEGTFFFGDRIRFETVRSDTTRPSSPLAHILDFTRHIEDEAWEIFKTAAMATGAVPVFLLPRVLDRNRSNYTPPPWESVASAATGNPPPISPNFPPGTPDRLLTLNVDGGVTNNDPFNYAHDYLASLEPIRLDGENPSTALGTDRAVISIAPFPTTDTFDIKYNPRDHSSIFSVLVKVLSALVSQSRFFGESLSKVMNGTTFNRFVIAPSDYDTAMKYSGTARPDEPPALQCATIGAFGGFFDRGFRAHDYALGRRNCQRFLKDSFVLPEANIIIKAALDPLDPGRRESIISRFKRPAPGTYAESKQNSPQADQTNNRDCWLPIIPLCSETLSKHIPPIERVKMSGAALNLICGMIMARFRELISLLISGIPSPTLRIFLRLGQPIIRFLARGPLREALINGLGDSYQP